MKRNSVIPMRQKLSTLWISVMFFYIYADIQGFYETGLIAKIMTGDIDGIIISQVFLLMGAVLMSIPIAMIFLTLILPTRICRLLNIILAFAHIVLAISVLFVGSETWSFWYYYTSLEVVTYIIIIVFSIKWKTPNQAESR